jgi:hypothetical protein
VPSEDTLARKLGSLWPQLNERQRRLVAAAEARALARGGISAVCRVAGISRPTVELGLRELEEAPVGSPARSRRPGGGRKKVVDKDPGIVAGLEALVEPTAIGTPARRPRPPRSESSQQPPLCSKPSTGRGTLRWERPGCPGSTAASLFAMRYWWVKYGKPQTWTSFTPRRGPLVAKRTMATSAILS